MITPFNVLALAKSQLHIYHDSYLDDVLLDESRRAFTMFKNRETFCENKFKTVVCDNVAQVPCKDSDITSLRFYDPTETYEVFPAWVNRFTEENFRNYSWNGQLGVFVNGITNTSTRYCSMYRFNGRTIVFFDSLYDTFVICGTYLGLMRDVDGELSFPDEYEKGLTDFVCYRYYALHNNDTQQNMMKAKEYHQQYIFECNRLAGEAGLMNTTEQIGIQRFTNAITRRGFGNGSGNGYGYGRGGW